MVAKVTLFSEPVKFYKVNLTGSENNADICSCRYLSLLRYKSLEKEYSKPALDKRSALVKAESYCAYQERAQQEVRNKLYDWGLRHDDVEEVITELIMNNFLNEERFAHAYVSGKFNIKKWGKIKIKQGLKLKKIPEKMIIKALNTIDYDDYLKTILAAAEKKSAVLVEKDAYKRKYKLITYLMGKGFENNLISEVLNDNNLS